MVLKKQRYKQKPKTHKRSISIGQLLRLRNHKLRILLIPLTNRIRRIHYERNGKTELLPINKNCLHRPLFRFSALQAEQIALLKGGQYPGSLVNISGIHNMFHNQ